MLANADCGARCRSALLAFLALAAPAHAGEVYRCKQADGVVAYSQQPCSAGQAGGRIEVAAVNPLERLIGPWRCSSADADLAPMRIAKDDAAGVLAALPKAQRDSLQQVASGYALGMCHQHGGGCSGSVELFRERRGVVFACAFGDRPSEARILEDGRVFVRRQGDDHIRVIDPAAGARGRDAYYRVDLEGGRIVEPEAGGERLEVVPRRDP